MDLQQNNEQLAVYRRRAAELVARMTLEEKVGQTLYDAPAIPRLGIPAYNWWGEALHGIARAGTATVFPQAIAMAALFDEETIETVGDAVSTEARAKYNAQSAVNDRDIYKGLTMWSPNVNIFRDPRWGRGHETYGEDPYLTSRLGVGYIHGLQGHDPHYLKTAACAKHFAVHSGPEAQRHQFDAQVTKQEMYDTYLPAFKACVEEAKVESVMGAYNRVNGEVCCAHPLLLEQILRKDWGFTGHVTSDYGAVRDFHTGHMVTQTAEDSAAMAMNHGCDLNAGQMYVHLTDAVKHGKVKEERIDEALVNLFTTRMKLGMFEAPGACPYDAIPYDVVDSPVMRALNLRVAERCPVLLKNNGILPLTAKKYKTIGVIGPNANSREALVGNYEGTASRYITVLEGIQDLVGDDARVLYAQGCHLFKDRVSGLARADDRLGELQNVCDASDVIVAVMGLDARIEGEEGDAGNEFGSGDKPDLSLPGRQQAVLELAKRSGKPVILVTLAGSALGLDWAQDNLDAVVHAFYPGAQGGKALARLLFGQVDFEGKLPVTFYHLDDPLPDFSDYHMEQHTYRYHTAPALYPFGYGLHYTRFAYANASLSAGQVGPEGLTVRADVTTTGAYAATETVEVYVKAPGGTPNAQLKGMAKVSLTPGETRTVEIALPRTAFAVTDESGAAVVPQGTFAISIGGSQPDARSGELTGCAVAVLHANA